MGAFIDCLTCAKDRIADGIPTETLRKNWVFEILIYEQTRCQSKNWGTQYLFWDIFLVWRPYHINKGQAFSLIETVSTVLHNMRPSITLTWRVTCISLIEAPDNEARYLNSFVFALLSLIVWQSPSYYPPNWSYRYMYNFFETICTLKITQRGMYNRYRNQSLAECRHTCDRCIMFRGPVLKWMRKQRSSKYCLAKWIRDRNECLWYSVRGYKVIELACARVGEWVRVGERNLAGYWMLRAWFRKW